MALNNKRVRRLWREEGLVCKPTARKKRRAGPGAGEQKRLTAEYPMHVVSFDFQSDVTSCGRHIRFFNVIDEYTRTALAIIARRSFTASDVIAALENISSPKTGTAPTYVRCDNGPEFTAAALINWCNTVGVGTAFIDPGSPWQNGFVESFNAQFRREQLSGEIMDTMAEAGLVGQRSNCTRSGSVPVRTASTFLHVVVSKLTSSMRSTPHPENLRAASFLTNARAVPHLHLVIVR